ncbi:MAG: P-loop NTPase [Phycisphaerales bacterium]|nr:P-loop NTPase [Phycisphaerales bacterium]
MPVPKPIARSADGQDQAARLRDMASRLQGPRLAGDTHPRPPVVCICSGKGGVGKTMLAVNLSIALGESRRSPLLIDADVGTANADLVCGLTPARRLDRVRGSPTPEGIQSVAIPGPGGMRLIPGIACDGWINDFTPRECAGLLDACGQISPAPQLVLVDAGAGIGAGVMSFVMSADLAVVVVTPEPTSLADAYALMKALHLTSTHGHHETHVRLAIVVNEAVDRAEAGRVYARLSQCAERFLGRSLIGLGSIPLDPAVGLAVRSRSPLLLSHPRSPSAEGVRRVAKGIEAILALPDNTRGVRSGAARLVRRLLFGKPKTAS